ncbi:hypothetical protein [Microcoleus sp. OTE_8_concoct_300]|uniref:hypothetical protein n=1 Tax=Microcoleus sp. OTE_8_concoct_300 TaxID=2964710 RepID=UPI00403F24AC
MTENYGKESETEGVRGEEKRQDLWTDTNSGSNAGRVSEGIRSELVTSDRENSKEGASLVYAIGGILDQLIDDAEKQLVKSRECIVWYREEAKEYEQKLNNLRKLKELQQQQITAAATAESSNDSEENLAE